MTTQKIPRHSTTWMFGQMPAFNTEWVPYDSIFAASPALTYTFSPPLCGSVSTANVIEGWKFLAVVMQSSLFAPYAMYMLYRQFMPFRWLGYW